MDTKRSKTLVVMGWLCLILVTIVIAVPSVAMAVDTPNHDIRDDSDRINANGDVQDGTVIGNDCPRQLDNDIILVPNKSLQPVQVVWQDDPDKNQYKSYKDHMEHLSEGEWKANIPMVFGKNTFLFPYNAHGNPKNIQQFEFLLLNHYPTAKTVRIEFRLIAPGFNINRRIYLSQQNWSVPRCGSSVKKATIDAPVPNDPFQFRASANYRIEAEVVWDDGSSINDDSPKNQDNIVHVKTVRTHSMTIAFKTFAFQGSGMVRGVLNIHRNDVIQRTEPFLQGTFPVGSDPPLDVQPRKLGPMKRAPQIGLVGHQINFVADWKDLYSSQRQLILEDLVLEVVNMGWAKGVDRVVLLVPPGMLEVDNSKGVHLGSPAKANPVVVVEWDEPPAVIAHELGHSYGLWTRTEQYQRFNGLPANGYWVNRREGKGKPLDVGSIHGQHIDFMAKQTNIYNWVNQPNYLDLVREFQILEDPRVIGIRGLLYENGTIRAYPWYIYDSSVADRTSNSTGNYSIVLLDDQGRTLSQIGFNISFRLRDFNGTVNTSVVPFMMRVPYHNGTEEIQIRNATGHVLLSRNLSAHPPTVNVTTPDGDEVLKTSEVTITWNGTDPDGDALTYTVLYSDDAGITWNPLVADYTNTSYVWDVRGLPAGKNYSVKVIASDGIRTDAETSTKNFTLTPVNTTVTNYTVSTTRILVNESLRVNATATNAGLTNESINATLYVDGAAVNTRSVSVSAATTTHTVLTTNLTTPEKHMVRVNTLPSTPVTVLAPAFFAVANLSTPQNVSQGNTITVRTTVTNTGDVMATQTVEFRFNGTVQASRNVSLTGSEEQTLTFTVNTSGITPGNHSLTVASGDEAASTRLRIRPPNPWPNGVPGVGGQPPADPDDDGLYEDVNGDGETNFKDAVNFAFADFNAINAGTQAQMIALDFDGDGDVDFDDAVVLAFEV